MYRALRQVAVIGIIVALATFAQSFVAASNADQFATTRAETGPGANVYAAYCAECHDKNLPKVPNKGILQMLAGKTVYAALTTGIMRTQGQNLSDDEKRAVAEYLTSKKVSAVPSTPPVKMCAEPLRSFDDTAMSNGAGWGLTAGSTHFVPESVAAIRKGNLAHLKLKWAFAYPDGAQARSQPAVAGGAVYVGSDDGSVYAIEQNSGCVRWKFPAAAEVRTGIVIGPWSEKSGPVLYFGDFLGAVYAVDARTGALIWKVHPEEHSATTITAAPVLHDGILYVSVSSMETISAGVPQYECCTFRGAVVALDAAIGATRWKIYTVPQTPARQGASAVGVSQFGPSGVPVWDTPVVDARRGQLYFGTGQNYSLPPTKTSDAIFAVDLKTGATKWIYQLVAGDAWNIACLGEPGPNCPKAKTLDFDFGAGLMLVSGSDGRDLLIGGEKSGMVVALDPDTGKLVWSNKVGAGGVLGGVHWGMAAANDALFIPVSDIPDGRVIDEPRRPGLYALTPNTGAFTWKSPAKDECGQRANCHPGNSAAITATSELVLAGGVDGIFRIHDAHSGEVLWSFDTTRDFDTVSGAKAHGGSMSGGSAPIPYKNQLFVNSGYAVGGLMGGNVLLAFELEE